MIDRRQFLTGAAGALSVLASSRVLTAQTASRASVLDVGGVNLVALSTSDGIVLVDSGPSQFKDQVMAKLNARVATLFNTHHHPDQTGNNEMFPAGTKIIAHKRTLEWMSSDHWIPGEDRYEKARAK